MAQTSVRLSTMQDTTRRALDKFPAERSRIERGALIVALGRLARTGPETFSVKSQTRPDTYYVVTVTGDSLLAVSCSCKDAERRPGQTCKHGWAVNLTLVAEERQRRLNTAWRARFADLSDAEIGRLRQWKRKYAAQPA